MSAYEIAWWVIAGAGVLGCVVLYYPLRHVGAVVRHLAVCIAAAFFLAPAPVPGHAEQLAPAFVVSIFEMFFQIDGAPGDSLRILLFALVSVAALCLLVHYLVHRLQKPGQ